MMKPHCENPECDAVMKESAGVMTWLPRGSLTEERYKICRECADNLPKKRGTRYQTI